MNTLFWDRSAGHHRMRDHLLTLATDADLAYRLPGANRTLGELLVEMGPPGACAHGRSFNLDWSHRELPPPERR